MRFLFRYRMTPHASTGVSPAELLMGRRLRSHLSMIHPVKEIGETTQELVQEKVRATQERQKKWHDKRAKPRYFFIGDQVLVLNFGRGPKWLPGKVTSIRGPVSVTVELADGRSVRRHYDHIRASSLSEAETVVQRDVVPRQHGVIHFPLGVSKSCPQQCLLLNQFWRLNRSNQNQFQRWKQRNS